MSTTNTASSDDLHDDCDECRSEDYFWTENEPAAAAVLSDREGKPNE